MLFYFIWVPLLRYSVYIVQTLPTKAFCSLTFCPVLLQLCTMFAQRLGSSLCKVQYMLKAGCAGRTLTKLLVLLVWMDVLYRLPTISSLCQWQARPAYCTFWRRWEWVEGRLNWSFNKDAAKQFCRSSFDGKGRNVVGGTAASALQQPAE